MQSRGVRGAREGSSRLLSLQASTAMQVPSFPSTSASSLLPCARGCSRVMASLHSLARKAAITRGESSWSQHCLASFSLRAGACSRPASNRPKQVRARVSLPFTNRWAITSNSAAGRSSSVVAGTNSSTVGGANTGTPLTSALLRPCRLFIADPILPSTRTRGRFLLVAGARFQVLWHGGMPCTELTFNTELSLCPCVCLAGSYKAACHSLLS
ncbi:hypothetical protein V8C86DRAFT_679343 [Haematococcus lacustris]